MYATGSRGKYSRPPAARSRSSWPLAGRPVQLVGLEHWITGVEADMYDYAHRGISHRSNNTGDSAAIFERIDAPLVSQVPLS